jgi:hypothetical protein
MHNDAAAAKQRRRAERGQRWRRRLQHDDDVIDGHMPSQSRDGARKQCTVALHAVAERAASRLQWW